MANAKISSLPDATTPITGTEVVPIVQGGVTVKLALTPANIGSVPSADQSAAWDLLGIKNAAAHSADDFATASDGTKGVAAYGWGDHSKAGYAQAIGAVLQATSLELSTASTTPPRRRSPTAPQRP
jgi:hypothetical protein